MNRRKLILLNLYISQAKEDYRNQNILDCRLTKETRKELLEMKLNHFVTTPFSI